MTPSEGCIAREARKRERLYNGGFLNRVDRSAGPDACWPWMGSRQTPTGGRSGYGFFTIRSKAVYVHRRVLELALGRALERGEIAMHSCDNPPCANPAHLSVATMADNSADMVRKGRSTARLTPDQVRAIRRAFAEGGKQRDIAAAFGVAQNSVWLIKVGRTHRQIGGAA